MSYRFDDRVRDTTTTIGTGNITCAGVPPNNYRAFTILATGDVFPYAVVHRSAAEWEVGIGTIISSNVFSRTVKFSSNSNAPVSFSSGIKDVVICPISDTPTMKQWLGLGVLFAPNVQTSQTGAGNPANTTETTLFTYLLSANSVNVIGRGLRISAAGYWGTGASRALIRLYFGTESILLDQSSTDGSRWKAQLDVIMTAAGPTRVNVSGVGHANFVVGPFLSNVAIDLTTNQTVKVTGQSPSAGTANQAVAAQLLVEPLSSDIAAIV